MIIGFRQGIVDYDFTTFPFLASGGGVNVSLIVGTRPITITVAQATNNYTFTETATINNAWTGLNPTGNSWLYWDFNTTTLVRTFGFTTLQPVAQTNAPLSPQTGQMWYNTSTFRNYVYQYGGWTEVLRVLASEYVGNASSAFQFISEGDQPPLPSGAANFTGTQIGVNQVNVATGFPLYNYNGVPLNQGDGTFLTTESVMFEQGTPITGVRLESNVYTAFSSDVTTIPAYAVVAFQSPNGTIQLASYNDAGNTAIAMAIDNIPAGGSGGVSLEGTITNTQWNFTGLIGELLWISGSQPGTLVNIDPHLSNPITYPQEQPPVARVLSVDTIIFLQGIGTQGPPGPAGNNGNAVPATPTVQGVVYLSTDNGAFTPLSNLVVAEGDPRLTNARTALASSILAATNITVASYTPINTYGTNVQIALQAIASNTLNLAGGTMTGNLILNTNPTVPFQAVTKQYVDDNFLSIETEVVLIAGSTMTGPLILSGNPTAPLQAATKQYVDSIAEGITFQAAVAAATTGPLPAVYAGAPNYTLTATANGILIIDGVTLTSSGPVSELGTITGGSGYTAGSYSNVPLTGGTGTGAEATVVVVGGGGPIINLNSSVTYAVIAYSTITNTGSSVVTGDLGLYPGTSVTGFPPGTVSGTQNIDNSTAQTAINDATSAFVSGNALPGAIVLSASTYELGGTTVAPGLYSIGTGATITGTVTLDAGGNVNAYFIFQIGSTLTTASSSVVLLTNGAQAANVYWLVGTSATFGTTSEFSGTVIAQASITDDGSSSVTGHLFALTGAVTLDDTAVTATPAGTGGGTGSVTSVIISVAGSGYLLGDTLSADNTFLGGTGSGFSVPVISILSERVLVKNQTNASQNGVYDVVSAGSGSTPWVLKRDVTELPPNTVVSGTFVFVGQGTQNISTGWVLATPNPITIDVTPLSFVQFSSAANVTYSSVITALGYIPVGPFSVTSGTGITVNGSPVSGASPSGVVLTLSTELVGLNALSSGGTGFVQRTGAGSYVAQSLTSTQVETALGYIPLASRTINTTAPLAGGGPLTSDLTLSITPFAGSSAGSVPASPGGTIQFLRADGTWSVPPGGSGGGVSSVGMSTTSTGLIITGTNPITDAGTIVINLNSELQALAALSTTGIVERTGPATYVTVNGQPNDVVFATASQTLVNLTNVTATSKFPSSTTSYIQVFVNGILQREDNSSGNAYAIEGSFYVSSSSAITFFNALSLNDEVIIYQL